MPLWENKSFKEKDTGKVISRRVPMNASAKAIVKKFYPEEGYIPIPTKEMAKEEVVNNNIASSN